MQIFARKTKLPFKDDLDKALRLSKRLFALHLVKYLLIFLAIVIVAPLGLFILLKPTTQKDINYGVTFSRKYSQQMGQNWQDTYIKILDDLKVKNIRLVAYWDDAEPYNNTYNFEDVKWQLEEAQKRDVKVIMTIGRKVPRYPECFEPTWWDEIKNKEQQERELLEYVSNAVLALKSYSTIKIWQVENEPFWPFGDCKIIEQEIVKKEIALVKSLDSRPVMVQDSGEGGFWFPTYQLADYLGISMYRRIWYDFWGIFMKRFIYFQYPLAHWTYKIKAELMGVPYNKIFVTELQGEPWGPGLNSQLSREDIDKTMSKTQFIDTINYAQKAGFKDLYFWGAEWWLFEKEQKGNPFYWDTAKALFNSGR